MKEDEVIMAKMTLILKVNDYKLNHSNFMVHIFPQARLYNFKKKET